MERGGTRGAGAPGTDGARRAERRRRCASVLLARGVCLTEAVGRTQRAVYLPGQLRRWEESPRRQRPRLSACRTKQLPAGGGGGQEKYVQNQVWLRLQTRGRETGDQEAGTSLSFRTARPEVPCRWFRGAVQEKGGNGASFPGTSFRINPAGRVIPLSL